MIVELCPKIEKMPFPALEQTPTTETLRQGDEKPKPKSFHRKGRRGRKGERPQSHVWDKFSVSPQGCTSKSTPNWDDLGCSGIPREGRGTHQVVGDRIIGGSVRPASPWDCSGMARRKCFGILVGWYWGGQAIAGIADIAGSGRAKPYR
jgi:hypothetical protein